METVMPLICGLRSIQNHERRRNLYFRFGTFDKATQALPVLVDV